MKWPLVATKPTTGPRTCEQRYYSRFCFELLACTCRTNSSMALLVVTRGLSGGRNALVSNWGRFALRSRAALVILGRDHDMSITFLMSKNDRT